jgi:hypothetical protein
MPKVQAARCPLRFDNADGLASGQFIGQGIHDRVNFKNEEHNHYKRK